MRSIWPPATASRSRSRAGRTEIEPDSPQTVERLQLEPGHVGGIIPKQPSLEHRPISQESGAEQKRPEGRVPQANDSGINLPGVRWRYSCVLQANPVPVHA